MLNSTIHYDVDDVDDDDDDVNGEANLIYPHIV